MNAMEKVAWTNLLVSAGAVVVVVATIPWLGAGATGFFALIALIPLSAIFLRQRGSRVIVDERDREIDHKAARCAVGASWMLLLFGLITVTIWGSQTHEHAVPTKLLNWLIWSQFATCFGIRGLAAIVLYRRPHAA
jgi:hypothetical protein